MQASIVIPEINSSESVAVVIITAFFILKERKKSLKYSYRQSFVQRSMNFACVRFPGRFVE